MGQSEVPPVTSEARQLEATICYRWSSKPQVDQSPHSRLWLWITIGKADLGWLRAFLAQSFQVFATSTYPFPDLPLSVTLSSVPFLSIYFLKAPEQLTEIEYTSQVVLHYRIRSPVGCQEHYQLPQKVRSSVSSYHRILDYRLCHLTTLCHNISDI